ncbi:hypothetical protein AF332_11290 [Sporosarcina globispora]|uniref:Uncharacterized protein n=1 Tax=Sporosarcina globispora TaxID=1459 RepID=A0A0M0GD47_SPOGL|nr:hypothetical protein [Sporosarcina globispora]KON87351.1 hypothetical protein AF332_11290 [Sporosarcina globispora]
MTKVTKKICSKCQKEKRLEDFYKSYAILDADERLRVCKLCVRDMTDIRDLESVKNTLRMLDKAFVSHLWDTALSHSNPVGEYFKLISMKDFRHMTWADSMFENESKQSLEIKEPISNTNNVNIDVPLDELKELKEIYGHGYPDEEYILFEKKFRKLKPSFQLPTTMHEEYLREYCVNKVKETLAKSKGEFKEAKEWSIMAKEAAEAGKLKPSQMSKADLSKGLDGFGQLSRMVEEHRDIIPLLPKFTEQPKDKVDVTLWLYVNYIRDLEGLPKAEYKDIYNFYEVRKQDYESQELDSSPEMQVIEEDE